MIVLPQLFSAKLAEKPTLLSSVIENFNIFEPWLEQSGMPFFPGFTDHSPRHITEVLQSAASLLSDESHRLLSSEDVCVLCISILLHDCGMHLTQDSFRNLIKNDVPPIIDAFGDRSWNQIWKEYLSEASRFGQEKLIAIFGSSEPVLVEDFHIENLSERDCLLVGEFVRRHHTRLAHEIALEGVGRENQVPLKLVGLEKDFRDLAGLVARSHGMSIRSTFDYISEKYSLIPAYRGIKTPYLMAVLRIADYIQVQSERALKGLLSVKELRSPISRLEWQAHFAVRDVSTAHADPEALYVHAVPIDARMFLKLTLLFKDIQRELDETWATLGEVYGRHTIYAGLGLTVRRIRSNLDDVKKFSKGVSYFPVKAKFDSSGSDLLSLLVGPLYDYEFEIGIRELIQNSVDACREAADLYKIKRKFEKYLGEVTVEFEEFDDETGWITVSDNGVGMSIDTIVKFYLIAGASFRNSDAWKSKHLDDTGESRVMRGGRFGVGALAAFLLGDEIKVTTRYFEANESDGIEFSARIDDSQVELRRCKAPPGTSIRILVANPEVIESLRPYVFGKKITKNEVVAIDNWTKVDWFVQSEPKVSYFWNGFNYAKGRNYYDEPRIRYQGLFLSDPFDAVPSLKDNGAGWNFISNPAPYKSLAWSYSVTRVRAAEFENIFGAIDEIIVNGIRVEKSGNSVLKLPKSDSFSSPVFSIIRPSLAILDPAGLCPINLQRSSVAFDRMDIDDKIARAVLKNIFESMREEFKDFSTLNDFSKIINFLYKQPGVRFSGQLSPLCICSKGVFISSAKNFERLSIKRLYFIDAADFKDGLEISRIFAEDEACVIRRSVEFGIQSALAWFRGVFGSDTTHFYSHARTIGAPDVIPSIQTAIVKNERWKVINEKGRVSKIILKEINEEKFDSKFRFLKKTQFDSVDDLKERMKEIFKGIPSLNELCAWQVIPEGFEEETPSLISEIWEDSFGGVLFF